MTAYKTTSWRKQIGLCNNLSKSIGTRTNKPSIAKRNIRKFSTAKTIENLSNTNGQNYLFYQATSLCPLCQAQEETFEHVLKCPATDASKYRKGQLSHYLKNSLQKFGTPTAIVHAIMQGFQTLFICLGVGAPARLNCRCQQYKHPLDQVYQHTTHWRCTGIPMYVCHLVLSWNYS